MSAAIILVYMHGIVQGHLYTNNLSFRAALGRLCYVAGAAPAILFFVWEVQGSAHNCYLPDLPLFQSMIRIVPNLILTICFFGLNKSRLVGHVSDKLVTTGMSRTINFQETENHWIDISLGKFRGNSGRKKSGELEIQGNSGEIRGYLGRK